MYFAANRVTNRVEMFVLSINAMTVSFSGLCVAAVVVLMLSSPNTASRLILRYHFTNVGYYTNATRNHALREIMTTHPWNQLEWSAQLVTGHVEYFPEKFTVSLVLPYGDDGSKLRAATPSFAEFLSNRTNFAVSQNAYNSYASYALSQRHGCSG